MGSTGFASWIWIELDITSGERTGMNLCLCGSSEPSLIWPLSGWEVTASICDCLRMISRVCLCSLNVVAEDVSAVKSIWSLTTTGTFNLAVPYFPSLSGKSLAASPHPRWVNWSSLNNLCQKLAMRWCTVLEIVPITQPGSSSSLSVPSSVFSSSCSISSPSCSSLELASSLRLCLIAFKNLSKFCFGISGYHPLVFSGSHVFQLL